MAAFNLRDSLYESPFPPTAIFDGTDEVFEQNPSLYFTTYEAHITAAKADTPSYNLELTAIATPSAGDMQIQVVTADTIPSGQMLAYAAICQDSVVWFDTYANYIVQEMFIFPVDLVYPDTLDTIITFSHTLPIDKMHAVFFIQNMDTKEIMHSATKKFEEVQ
jgi:hypothetical protein